MRSLLHSEPCKSCFFCPHLSVHIPIIDFWPKYDLFINHKGNSWDSRNITCLTQRHAHYTEGLSCHRLSTFNLQQQYNAFKYFFKSYSNFHTFTPFLRDFWYLIFLSIMAALMGQKMSNWHVAEKAEICNSKQLGTNEFILYLPWQLGKYLFKNHTANVSPIKSVEKRRVARGTL